jgi:hypothetical protein
MVKVIGVPEQVVAPLLVLGVTVIVAVTEVEPVLTAVKAGTSPVPLAANPIEVLLLVQLYVVVPLLLLVENATDVVLSPLQTD